MINKAIKSLSTTFAAGGLFLSLLTFASNAGARPLLWDDFDENSLNVAHWVEKDVKEDYIRPLHNKLYLLGDKGWDTTALYGRRGLPRTGPLVLCAVLELNRPGLALGFKKDNGPCDLTSLEYGLYFAAAGQEGEIHIYEGGALRKKIPKGCNPVFPYRVKIVLPAEGGARYYIQGNGFAPFGDSEWTELYRSGEARSKAGLRPALMSGASGKNREGIAGWAQKLDEFYVSAKEEDRPIFIKNIMVTRLGRYSAVLLVKTSVPAQIKLAYGLSVEYDSFQFSSGAYIHEIALEKLRPASTYNYQISAVAAHDMRQATNAWGSFTTRPPRGDFTFAVLGDMQQCEAGDVTALAEKNRPDLVITVGDNIRGERAASSEGYAYRWESDVFSYLQGLSRRAPIYFALGNHDYVHRYPEAMTAYHLETSLPVSAAGGKRYYSFDYGRAHFVVLDSSTAGDKGAIDQTQLKWLRSDLRDTRQKLKFVFAHHMVYGADEKGLIERWFGAKDYSDLWRVANYRQLHRILSEHEVAVYFSGHRHVYNRYRKDGVYYVCNPTAGAGRCLLKGYFGEDDYENEGGDEGTIPRAIGNISGYTRVTVKADSVEISVLNDQGRPLDGFSIYHRPKAPPPGADKGLAN